MVEITTTVAVVMALAAAEVVEAGIKEVVAEVAPGVETVVATAGIKAAVAAPATLEVAAVEATTKVRLKLDTESFLVLNDQFDRKSKISLQSWNT